VKAFKSYLQTDKNTVSEVRQQTLPCTPHSRVVKIHI